MIVKDKALTLERANEISDYLLNQLVKKSIESMDGDDPADQIYLAAHIFGQLLCKIALSIEGYGKVYGITGMDAIEFMSWVKEISTKI